MSDPIKEIYDFIQSKRSALDKKAEQLRLERQQLETRIKEMQERLIVNKKELEETEFANLLVEEEFAKFTKFSEGGVEQETPAELENRPEASQPSQVQEEPKPEKITRLKVIPFNGNRLQGYGSSMSKMRRLYNIIVKRFPQGISTYDLFHRYQDETHVKVEKFKNYTSFKAAVTRFYNHRGFCNLVERTPDGMWFGKQDFRKTTS